MTPRDIADAILVHANEVRRLRPPPHLNGQSERFYSERSEIVSSLTALAEKISPAAVKAARPAAPTAPPERRVINGRLVIVQAQRRSFAITTGR